MNRQEFSLVAGGRFEYHKHYGQLSSDEKRTLFWGFFDEQLSLGGTRKIKYRSEVLSIYAGVRVEDLVEKEKYSIEHIIPQEILSLGLERQGVPHQVVMGATVNPFNFMACHRYLNSKRNQRAFDFDGDEVVLTFPVQLPARYSDYGIDKDDQWVVPLMTRGDVARAILYMSIVYELDYLRRKNTETLLAWAKNDKPSLWEINYNRWVHARHQIRNPFIHYPSTRPLYDAHRLLDDEELLFG